MTTFIKETRIYVGRMREFSSSDWLAYAAWVGLMLGLFGATAGFTLLGYYHGIDFPGYVWSVPVGTAIFVGAIAFDTIGHRTIYREELAKGEALVHHVTIFAGISSCVLLCLAYRFPLGMRWPSLVMVALSIFYSVIDEAFHWRRYIHGHSDRVEMWSHFFIFVGHLLMILSWSEWYFEGYPGVKETLAWLF